MERTIIHLNITGFAVAVERLLDQSLKDRPLIMTATDSWRAAVHDMSEEAFHEGVGDHNFGVAPALRAAVAITGPAVGHAGYTKA